MVITLVATLHFIEDGNRMNHKCNQKHRCSSCRLVVSSANASGFAPCVNPKKQAAKHKRKPTCAIAIIGRKAHHKRLSHRYKISEMLNGCGFWKLTHLLPQSVSKHLPSNFDDFFSPEMPNDPHFHLPSTVFIALSPAHLLQVQPHRLHRLPGNMYALVPVRPIEPIWTYLEKASANVGSLMLISQIDALSNHASPFPTSTGAGYHSIFWSFRLPGSLMKSVWISATVTCWDKNKQSRKTNWSTHIHTSSRLHKQHPGDFSTVGRDRDVVVVCISCCDGLPLWPQYFIPIKHFVWFLCPTCPPPFANIKKLSGKSSGSCKSSKACPIVHPIGVVFALFRAESQL